MKSALSAAVRRIAGLFFFFLAGLLAASRASGQQTIFNVPDPDVLEKGKTYLELNALWRLEEPRFADFVARGVWGVGGSVEVGVNLRGFMVPGRSTPIAEPNVKWQPWSNEVLSFTAGAAGQFFLRGARDGTPSAFGYAHAAAKLPSDTRLTAGGYWASSGYAADNVQKGVLAGVEQKLGQEWTVAADWFSGKNSIGYLTPGVIWKTGDWTVYAGYSFKNRDSRGNGVLTQLGFEF
jgi:hypothetical protein